ncbi:MAG: 4-hydroxy-3-methylbut-2-enyl diphosphate reductase [Deltaproteobacteria bacterium]|nr:4-hydroxy-3-methylbut-2-enyl diphosphate reductase [Deltaproteobacteria bacterium]
MEIILAENAGYCFGVKRAVEIVEDVLRKFSNKRIYSLGDIIHNPQVVQRLKEKGLRVVTDVDEIENESVVIISAHGRSEKDIKQLKNKKCLVVNATCPYVKFPQSVIKKLSKEKYFIVLFGDKNHPEVKGLISYTDGKDIVVVDREISDFDFIKSQKVGILAQTTQSREDFLALVFALAGRFRETRVFNTICDATKIRQEEAIRIAKSVDLMLVVGGKNSANTKRLYEISSEYCPNVIHIETQMELRKDYFSGVKRVGITAGASTPDDIIREVIERIKSFRD